MALHSYHTAHGEFPDGVHRSQEAEAPSTHNYTLTETPLRRFNWTIAIMPYGEQDAVYNLWNMTNFAANQGVTGDPAKVSWRVIKPYLCPSDMLKNGGVDVSDGDGGPHWAIVSYGANAGRRNYRRRDQTSDGPFVHCTPRKISDISDGTSNTIFVGERLHKDPIFDSMPGEDIDEWGRWAFGAEGDVLLSAAERINWQMTNATDAEYELRLNVFGSAHTGGANFCMGDGSVRYLTDGLDLATLERLCMHRDGAVVTLP